MEVVRPRQVVKITIAMLSGALIALMVCYPDWIWDIRLSILPKRIDAVGGWIESHPGLAGWVQAVGSIAAIVFSLRVARRQTAAQESIEQKRRDLEVQDRKAAAHRIAVDHAIVVFPSVFSWALEMSRIEKEMAEENGGSRLAKLVHAHKRILDYGIPPTLQKMFGRFHEFDSVAESVQKAVVATATLNDTKSNMGLLIRGEAPDGYTVDTMIGEIERAVCMQIRCVQEASRKLTPLYTGKGWRSIDESK